MPDVLRQNNKTAIKKYFLKTLFSVNIFLLLNRLGTSVDVNKKIRKKIPWCDLCQIDKIAIKTDFLFQKKFLQRLVLS